MRSKTVVQHVAMAALVLAAVSAPAAAQATLELTPHFTSYYAMSQVLDVTSGASTLEAKQIAGPGIGSRLTYWTSSGLGFEAAGTFIFSGVRVLLSDPTDPTLGIDQSQKGTILAATGRLLYRLPRSNFHLLGGAGAVFRGGEVWQGLNDASDIAGVAGFGARASVTPKLSLDVKVEGYFYSFNSLKDLGVDSKFQTDFLISIGVPLALMK